MKNLIRLKDYSPTYRPKGKRGIADECEALDLLATLLDCGLDPDILIKMMQSVINEDKTSHQMSEGNREDMNTLSLAMFHKGEQIAKPDSPRILYPL